MPDELRPGVLYVSKEFETAHHLCACGCGAKIRTPLGPTEWTLDETLRGPTLWPSIGNWQQACQSHYWIRKGGIVWAEKWTPQQIARGRQAEEHRRTTYYEKLYGERPNLLARVWRWLMALIGR
jgi:hypothetical protein